MLYHFPRLYPDETLYSGWARYGEHSGHPKKEYILEELFGKPSGTVRFIFEKRIDSFASNFPDNFPYTADYLLQHHTLFPLYSFTLHQWQAMNLKSAMKGEGRLWRGAQQFIRIGSHLPKFARYCIECAKQDVEVHGETYWHRIHQIADINICAIHNCWLENSTHNVIVERLRLVTATEAVELSRLPKYLNSTTEGYEYFQLVLANSAEYFLNVPMHNLYLEDVRERYKSILFELGLSSPTGRLYGNKFEQFIYSKYHPDVLMQLQELYGFHQFWQTLRMPGHRIVPSAIHFLIICFLGLDANSFVAHTKVTGPFGEGPWPCKNPFCNNFNKPVIKSYEFRKHNSKPWGIFTCDCEFSYKIKIGTRDIAKTSEPTVYYFGSLWNTKIAKLYRDHELTAGEINDLLRFTQLNDKSYNRIVKQEQRRDIKRSQYRDECLKLLETFPYLTRAELFKKNRHLYSRLVIQDRKWFDNNLPESGRGNFTFRGQISDWEQHDKNLLESLQIAYDQEMLLLKRPRRITINYLLSQSNIDYGNYKYHVRRGRFPKTVQFLNSVCETQDKYVLRLLRFVIQYYLDKKIVPIKISYMWWFRLKINDPQIERKIEEGYEIIKEKISNLQHN